MEEIPVDMVVSWGDTEFSLKNWDAAALSSPVMAISSVLTSETLGLTLTAALLTTASPATNTCHWRSPFIESPSTCAERTSRPPNVFLSNTHSSSNLWYSSGCWSGNRKLALEYLTRVGTIEQLFSANSSRYGIADSSLVRPHVLSTTRSSDTNIDDSDSTYASWKSFEE